MWLYLPISKLMQFSVYLIYEKLSRHCLCAGNNFKIELIACNLKSITYFELKNTEIHLLWGRFPKKSDLSVASSHVSVKIALCEERCCEKLVKYYCVQYSVAPKKLQKCFIKVQTHFSLHIF